MAQTTHPRLLPLTPLQQLRAGRLPLRLVNLFVGLTLFGAAMAVFIRAGLGQAPWDVLHVGLSTRLPLSIGTIIILLGFVVLLLWIPLRQWPGLGTIANVLWLGVAADLTLWLVPPIEGLGWQIAAIGAALVVNGIGGALYIGSQFGPGPRDGLMTGVHLRTGISMRLVRTVVEVTVLAIGWFLGGIVGVGTVAYALLIGPLTQFFLRWSVVELPDATVPPEHDATARPAAEPAACRL
ncbi:hypothetical protein [Zhihengliuella sp.]|uniref:membrane protein YczE n=1 Tax=Zhihengliuella sp. TaxID=1954483 RepID=UPI002811ACBF|nr:hypothetical protein [Zhihengliuella sp.]